MKTNRYLLPSCFRKIGWIVSPPLTAILLIVLSGGWGYHARPEPGYNFVSNFTKQAYWRVLDLFAGSNLVHTACMIGLLIGLLFIAFSREKIEDEFITKLRGDSLIWAVIANSVLLILSFALIYEGWFLYVAFLNLYLLLVLYIAKFRIALYRFKKSNSHEE